MNSVEDVLVEVLGCVYVVGIFSGMPESVIYFFILLYFINHKLGNCFSAFNPFLLLGAVGWQIPAPGDWVLRALHRFSLP